MAKDAYWFRHETTANRGTRMRKMAFIHGHWGKGVYWDVIEQLRDQHEYEYEKDEMSLRMLADIIGCKDAEKFLSWYNDCIRINLFQENGTHFYSEKLKELMGVWEVKKSNGSKGGRPKKNLTETETKPNQKPNQKPNGNLTNNLNETETKANQKLTETIREEKRIEENRRVDSNKQKTSLIEIYFDDFPKSSAFEKISVDLGIQKDDLLKRLPDFKIHSRTSYKNFNDFADHFKYWVMKNKILPNAAPKKSGKPLLSLNQPILKPDDRN